MSDKPKIKATEHRNFVVITIPGKDAGAVLDPAEALDFAQAVVIAAHQATYKRKLAMEHMTVLPPDGITEYEPAADEQRNAWATSGTRILFGGAEKLKT